MFSPQKRERVIMGHVGGVRESCGGHPFATYKAINILYGLDLHNVVCQLYLNKVRKKCLSI